MIRDQRDRTPLYLLPSVPPQAPEDPFWRVEAVCAALALVVVVAVLVYPFVREAMR